MPPWRTDPLKIGQTMNKTEAKEARRLFLIELKSCGVISQAARKVGLTPSKISGWRKEFPKFDKRVEKVLDEFVDSLEVIAIERAKDKSDSLLLAMLKAYRPEKFHDRTRSEVNMSLRGDKESPVKVIFSQDEVGEADVKGPEVTS
jgi:hypothetical protein